MKLAVLFDNFGPYHVARLNAAAGVAEVLGVEYAAASHEYDWIRDTTAQKFRRVTLVDGASNRRCGVRALVARLGSALSEFAPDAVAVPGWSGRLSLAALSWCVRSGVPAIAMSESTADDRARQSWKEAIKRRLLAACGAGLAGGQPQRDYLMQLGMPASRVFLGYDAVDNEHFARGAAEAASQGAMRRAELGLPERYFLASARFVAKKNLPALVQAYAKYRGSVAEPWDLVILGDGELRPALEQLRGSLGLDAHVQLPGFKQYDELPGYYGLASGFIHASTVEQWGLVVNEALAAGLPALVSKRCGCASTLVREGVNGATFDPASIEQLAAEMRRLSELPEAARRAMGAASRAIVAEFGPERFATGLQQAAEAALAVRDSRRRWGDSLLFGVLLASGR